MAVPWITSWTYIFLLSSVGNAVGRDQRIYKQLNNFKSNVNEELSQIRDDIDMLFDSFTSFNVSVGRCLNISKALGRHDNDRPEGGQNTPREVDKSMDVVKSSNLMKDVQAEKQMLLMRAFQVEKQMNREFAEKIKQVEKTVNNMESKVGDVMSESLLSRVETIESGRKANALKIEQLEDQLEKIEKHIIGVIQNSILIRLDDMTANVNFLRDKLAENDKAIDDMEADRKVNRAKIEQLDERLKRFEKDDEVDEGAKKVQNRLDNLLKKLFN